MSVREFITVSQSELFGRKPAKDYGLSENVCVSSNETI